MKKRYSQEIKRRAEKLKKSGKSYSEIMSLLRVPKSTLSSWLGKKFAHFTKEQQDVHLAKIRKIALAAVQKRIKKRDEEVSRSVGKEVAGYPIKNPGFLKTILGMLYWAEGAKYKGVSGLKIVNTDPDLLRLYITLLRKCYKINEDKFRIRLHLHYYHNKGRARKFWSDVLGIPESRPVAVFVKKRSRSKRFRKNFMGICFVNYCDSSIRREILEINRQLLKKLVRSNVPVV